jgi:hypothetical protein
MPDKHDTPKISSDTGKLHVLDRTCWCKPEVLVGPQDDLIVHNEVEWVEDDDA